MTKMGTIIWPIGSDAEMFKKSRLNRMTLSDSEGITNRQRWGFVFAYLRLIGWAKVKILGGASCKISNTCSLGKN